MSDRPVVTGPAFADIKIELLSRIDRLVRDLAPGGRVNGDYYISKNPTRADRRAGSFWIRIKGQAKGAWRDEATAETGDIIDFVEYCAGLSDAKAARQWCLDWLGWSNQSIDHQALAQTRAKFREQQRRDDMQAGYNLIENRKKAFAMWLGAEKNLTGTLAETYLASRNIDLSKLKRPPGVLRFLSQHYHKDEDGKQTQWPVMIAAMSDAKGQIGAVHRTWLNVDGSGKAPVKPSRKIWPNYKGYVMRIAKCKYGHSPEEAARQGLRGPLIITEGIEDALSVSLACPEYRVWAAGTLANIGAVPVLPCISRIIICADNDWNNPQAENLLASCIAALKRQGVPVFLVRSWHGKDPNDLLRGQNNEQRTRDQNSERGSDSSTLHYNW